MVVISSKSVWISLLSILDIISFKYVTWRLAIVTLSLKVGSITSCIFLFPLITSSEATNPKAATPRAGAIGRARAR